MKHMTRQSKTVTTRSGFTLLELMAVITIIAILLSLILPAISGAMRNARTVAVQTEFRQFEQALATFENRFNTLPPSYLKIPAAGNTWDTQSRSIVRAMWPQFKFSTNGGLNNSTAFNLNGAECLVFFLGGVESKSGDVAVLSGFSKDPQTPWTKSTSPEGPFFIFRPDRIVDTDGDSLFEYTDAIEGQETPILFLSSRGKRYNTSNGTTSDDYDVFGSSSDMSKCYMEADGKTPQRRDSYQLISPGDDGEYGTGGNYSPDEDFSGRIPERDNITNFSDGTLG